MTRFVLPEFDSSWSIVQLGNLARINYGNSLTAAARALDGNVPVYGSGGIVGAHNEALLAEKSIIIGRKGSVGSVFLTEGPFWCIDTAYYLDELNESVDWEYLSTYLKLANLSKLSISVGVPGLNRNDLASVPIPIPTLPEQRRIVEVLSHAKSLGQSSLEMCESLDPLLREQYIRLFGDVFLNDKGWRLLKISQLSEVVRGSSPRPKGDPRLFGGSIPRLMVSDLTRDGLWVNATTDSLTEEGAKSSRPMTAQSVVMAVSGAPGMTAILNHDACIHDGLVGLRELSADLLPEFVAFTLNLLRAKNDQQAVGAVFRNLTTDQVKGIVIPVPPIEKQIAFREFLLQWKSIKDDIEKSKLLHNELTNALTIDAFTGKLTNSWREKLTSQITESAVVRDKLLQERGTKLVYKDTEKTNLLTNGELKFSSSRYSLTNQLSEFQNQVMTAFTLFCQESSKPLVVEDPEVFALFCEDDSVTERLQKFGDSLGNRIRRTLSQLSSLGLIAKITLPKQNVETSEYEYLKAFRPLRAEELTRMTDLQQLRKALSNSEENTLYFEAELDYETSSSTGADGMFQVIALTDSNGKDTTHLIDQGVHYTSLDDLRNDIADKLGVSKKLIVLEVA